MRQHHGALGRLLQVLELRHHQRVLVMSSEVLYNFFRRRGFTNTLRGPGQSWALTGGKASPGWVVRCMTHPDGHFHLRVRTERLADAVRTVLAGEGIYHVDIRAPVTPTRLSDPWIRVAVGSAVAAFGWILVVLGLRGG